MGTKFPLRKLGNVVTPLFADRNSPTQPGKPRLTTLNRVRLKAILAVFMGIEGVAILAVPKSRLACCQDEGSRKKILRRLRPAVKPWKRCRS
jgi:hypothetical protein